ncbi:MAG: hypothetical protein CBARDCOR_1430 [uncultured Caballeronia sp.]|nr:MAG: hypothetical protein CBARDCOR_1430 [uncultured Caballeronia sp.]
MLPFVTVPLPDLLICCLCAYLPHDDPSRAALMNRFYLHGADSKNKKVRKNTNAR